MGKGNRNTGHFVGKRLLALVLLLSFTASFLYVSAATDATPYVPIFETGFEHCTESTYYSHYVSGGDWNYIAPASQIRGVGSGQALYDQRSIQIKQCDLRWNQFKAEDHKLCVAFTFQLDSDFNQKIQFILSTQDALTDLAQEVGILLEVTANANGNPVLQGSDMTTLAELKKNETYHVETFVDRSSNIIQISLNGKRLDATYRYISEIYFIDGLRVLSTVDDSKRDAGSWILDGLSVSTQARTYVQAYSGQEPGNPVSVTVPDAEKEALRVYVNGIQIGVQKTYASSQTVYVSAEQFFKSISVPYEFDKEQKLLTVSNDRVTARVFVPSNTVEINGSTVELAYPVRMIDQVIMLPPQFINEVFNAKVWWDPSANLLVITTGAYKNNDKLMKLGSELYMNGEPYYAVGAYVPELFRSVMKRYLDPANITSSSWTEEAASELRSLQEQGVNAIRFSCSTDLLPDLLYDDVSMGKYLEAMDALLTVCDQYHIQVVLCFDLLSPCFLAKENAPRYGWLQSDESVIDLVSDSSSKSRSIVTRFLDKFTARYKDRSTILLYELSDRGNLSADTGTFLQHATYSIGQLASFYQDCVETIRKSDPMCIVSSGDAAPLLYQWQLYTSVMEGEIAGNAFVEKYDNEATRTKVLWMLHSCFDIVSVQFDDAYLRKMDEFYLRAGIQSSSGELLWYLRTANRFDKSLYSGLSYGSEDIDTGNHLQDNSMDSNLYKTVLAGVPLSFWKNITPKEMAQGTQLLTATYAENIVSAENTNLVWLNAAVDVFDPAGVISKDHLQDGRGTLDRFLQFAVVSAVLIVFSAVIVLTFKNKRGV
ncbi:MAG: hypothetical protein J6L76_01680 [Clostridia bacterium]|nr:hypothetical protein [Clostridia bacterium]